ncbi:unnamed protein product [Phyllotreta striolata]|uniref:Coiled-coil-helix-coiled-coil-helix domain-containing protein 10, mitochondrial n=1 Tax=Phyllotreta striolata TaxID=444603 RepID=A0A9N9XSR6_PHYSR|nr:unnamed protein product [Phyllotreta striolata]
MPRRQARSGSPSHNKRSYSTAPAHPPKQYGGVKEQKQPGLFGQMAATAGGVAVGSAVGHAVGRAVTGMMGGGSRDAHPERKLEEPVGPCAREIQRLLDCAADNSDITLCQGFNEAVNACKEKHNIR